MATDDGTEESLKLQRELRSLKEKLSLIENTIMTKQDGSISPPKKPDPFLYKNFNQFTISDSPTPTYGLSPLQKSKLPRTSISSLMNPLPVSGIRYSYEPTRSTEHYGESYLTDLGIDEREKIEFNAVSMATLSRDGQKYSSYGPLKIFAIMLQDKHLKSIRSDIIEFTNVFHKNPKNINLPPNNSGAKMFENDEYDDVSSGCLQKKDGNSTDHLHKTPEATFPKKVANDISEEKRNGSVYNICSLKRSDDLLSSIIRILPNLKEILMLIERYFNYVYPFLPGLSKQSFIGDVHRLLGIENTTGLAKRIDHINIIEKIDYATIGTLLIILKLGHDTMMTNSGTNKSGIPPPKLSSEMIDISRLCLRKFALFTEPSLKVFQFGMLYRSYHMFQGFESVYEKSSMIFNGLLTQIAYAIGLNRDPSKFEIENRDPELENRWRFLWYMILHIDSAAFYSNGSNRLIKREFFDTKMPNYIEKDSNLSNEDIEIENMTIKMLTIRTEFDELLSNLTDIVCRLSPLPSSGEVFGTLDKLNNAILTKFGPLSLFLNSKKSKNHVLNIQKVLYMSIYTNALSTIQTVYCHLIFDSEKKQNFVACRYLIAKFIAIFMTVIANYKKVINDSDSIYGEEFDWLATSLYSKLLSRSLLGILICFFRVSSARNKFSGNDATKFGLLNTLLYNLFDKKVWNLYLPYAKKISNKSFFAWKLLKHHTLIQKVTDTAKVTTDCINDSYNVFEFMSISDIQTFVELSNIKLYTTDTEEPALRVKSILDKLKSGASFESSHIDQQLTNIEDGLTPGMTYDEFLPSPYEDKYWGELITKEAYLYDDGDFVQDRPINNASFMI